MAPMRSGIFLILGALGLSGCVSSRLYHDRASAHNPSYYTGSSIPSVRPVFSENRADREVRGGEDVAALLTSALMLAQNPDYYQKSTIGGHCVRGPEDMVPLQAPCTNVTFVLMDESGNETERIFSESGKFQFFAEPDRVYFVSVLSGDKTRQGRVGPVRMGDEVVIRLNNGRS